MTEELKRHEIKVWPTVIRAYEWRNPEYDKALVEFILAKIPRLPKDAEDEIRLRKLFEIDHPLIRTLKGRVIKAFTDYLGPHGVGTYKSYRIDGRAVILPDRGFIAPHVERNEASLTIAYWPVGDAEGKALSSVSNPRFVVSDPSRYMSDLRLPHEDRHSISIGIRPGLMLVMPSHIPHSQYPYQGDTPHIQIVCNVQLDWTDEYLQGRW